MDDLIFEKLTLELRRGIITLAVLSQLIRSNMVTR